MENKDRITHIETSDSSRDSKGRGRPSKAQEVAELRKVVCSALRAYHRLSRLRNPGADRLLEAQQLPLIAAVRAAARDSHLGAWQILRLVVESAIDDEIELLTSWIMVLKEPEMKQRRQKELDVLRGYFCSGKTLAGFKKSLDCHATTVYRSWLRPLFDDLVDRIVLTLRDDKIGSPNLMEAIRRHGDDRAERLHRLR